jgi:exopolysaccharide biosynthesis polyprenyl glycosylphosphotransferase
MSRIDALRETFRLRPVPLLGRLQISERRLLLRAGDAAVVLLGLLAATLLWLRIGAIPLSPGVLREQWLWAGLLGLTWMAWLGLSDAHSLHIASRFPAVALRIGGGALAAAFAYLALFFLTSRAAYTGGLTDLLGPLGAPNPLPRVAPAASIAFTAAGLLVWRGFYAWSLSGPLTRRRVLVLGAGRAGSAICKLIRETHYTYYEVVGFVDDDPAKQRTLVAGVPVLAGHDQLAQLVARHRVDEVVVAISAEVRGTLFQALMDCHERGVSLVPMPLLYEELTGRIAVEHVGSQWYIALPLQPTRARTANLFFKRAFDLVAGLLLGALLLVLLPLLALAIRLDSPGPALYVQERVGLHGRRFRVWKFRSMYQDAEPNGEAQWASSNDPRITRVGRVLRRTRLDELPQAWNVLRGEMSVVGPRPERAAFVEQLQHQIPFYRTRLAAKPGLTGWAQINQGYSSTIEETLVKLQYDLFYLKHQSLWFDLLILARTISVVLRMKGQ